LAGAAGDRSQRRSGAVDRFIRPAEELPHLPRFASGLLMGLGAYLALLIEPPLKLTLLSVAAFAVFVAGRDSTGRDDWRASRTPKRRLRTIMCSPADNPFYFAQQGRSADRKKRVARRSCEWRRMTAARTKLDYLEHATRNVTSCCVFQMAGLAESSAVRDQVGKPTRPPLVLRAGPHSRRAGVSLFAARTEMEPATGPHHPAIAGSPGAGPTHVNP